VSLFACSGNDMGTKQIGGGVLGGALGGLAGSLVGGGTGKLAAVAAGTLLGALLGSEVGKSLDKADKMYAERAEQTAYGSPIGQPVRWNNPNSGNYGQVVATRDGTSSRGEYCREFQQEIIVGGQVQHGYGVACRQQDGSWKMLPQ
jgi:surface antigen